MSREKIEMFDLAELEKAAALVHAVMPPTPQYAWPLLSARLGSEVWVKHENHTPTGAFKVRGGLVYLDNYKRRQPKGPGLMSATRGNHGQSLAFASRRLGVPLTILVPHGNSREKNAAMRAFGAELLEVGRDFDMAREAAERMAVERGLEMVPSFCADLVKGVATYALEFFRGAPDLDTVYVPIGMGSGIVGVIRTRDLLGLKTRIVGVVSTQAPGFALSFKARKPVTTPTADTFADGVACRVPPPDAVDIVCAGADRIVAVGEEEVAAAMRAYFADTHNAAEGAGAVGLAALMQESACMRGKRVGVILSGGNIDMPMFAGIIGGGSVQQARLAAAS
jgi:threonine dehydratase